MKFNKIFAAALVALAIASCGTGNSNGPVSNSVKALEPSKGAVDTVSYLLGINFGSMVKGYDFGELNFTEVVKGMKAFINAEGTVGDSAWLAQFKINPNDMGDLINAFLAKRNEYSQALNKEKGDLFLVNNAKNADVQETPSGLQYTIIEAGNTSKVPGPRDTVSVLYKGTLLDGTVFDQTPEGSAPITFPLSNVIAGWTEGLQLVGEGGKIKLFIPADLAYGTQGSGAIGPNEVLVFDVELKEVKPFVEPAPETEE
ncbi:MAG: FKBP-type peptidyl-prolyl cis-trans isomerase [Bacteroidales bacterium]|nr:FKBP-type peptidyl-prolyl cis-trans isomerase [Bacteroidales bacterium]